MVETPHVAADPWIYCRLCSRWYDGIVLEPTWIVDPVDASNKILLDTCQRCREIL